MSGTTYCRVCYAVQSMECAGGEGSLTMATRDEECHKVIWIHLVHPHGVVQLVHGFICTQTHTHACYLGTPILCTTCQSVQPAMQLMTNTAIHIFWMCSSRPQPVIGTTPRGCGSSGQREHVIHCTSTSIPCMHGASYTQGLSGQP